MPGVRARAGAVGAVVGGGLLGLEAANALRLLGLSTHVVEFAPRLMPLQVDEAGGAMLRRLRRGPGRHRPHSGVRGHAIRAARTAAVAALELSDGGVARRRPGRLRRRHPAPRRAGPGRRPGRRARAAGSLVDDDLPHRRRADLGDRRVRRRSTAPVLRPGRARATRWPRWSPTGCSAATATFPGADTSTKLKLLGVDVACFGDATADRGPLDVTFTDPATRVYAKLVLSDDAQTLLGGVLVGDASAYPTLRACLGGPLPAPPLALLAPAGGRRGAGGAARHRAGLLLQRGHQGRRSSPRSPSGCADVPALKACTRAGTSCGSCVPLLKQLLDAAGRGAVQGAVRALRRTAGRSCSTSSGCAASAPSPQLVAEHGRGRGCDICKPAVASILASLGSGHILDGEQAALQDTNDHFLANLQRDGTLLGGAAHPRRRDHPGEAHRDRRGGPRLRALHEDHRRAADRPVRRPGRAAAADLAPAGRRRLRVRARLRQGAAHGEVAASATTWCRYGVQDSVGLAIALELRYRGLRAPHKIKSAVSGCARECAEARSKDFGIIATENGWNLYVGGNGGFRPRHADLFATDLSTEELIRSIDRFLMFYIRTADRLQRTAAWIEAMEGGLDHLRAVIVDDSLGLCAELDAAMARHVDVVRRRVAGHPGRPGAAAPVRLVRQRPGHARPVDHVRRRTRPAGAGAGRPVAASDRRRCLA